MAKRIYLVVLLVLAGTALVALISWNSVRGLANSSRRLGEVNLSSVAVIYEISDAYETQNSLVTRGPAQTDMKELEKMVKDYTQACQRLDAKLAELKKVDVQGALSEKTKAIETDLPALRQSSAKVFALSAQFQQVDAVTLLQTEVNGMQDRIGNHVDDLMKMALAAAQVQPGLIVQQANGSNHLIVGLCVAVFFVSLLISILMVRSQVVRPVKNVADHLAATFQLTEAGVGEITENSRSVAEGASEQAASLEETSSSLEEMSSMTKRNADNAHKANDLAKQARSAADKGAADMQTMSTAMEAIKVSSNDIAKIIKTIDEIAFQTNILALNAAVEAARAGEAGMGFAVVADEVRNLAQRSAQAAKETAGKIEGAIIKTGQGVEISNKVAAALNEIVTKVRQVDELVAEVANASREQTDGITQINVAVGQMDKVTQSNAATAEESAAAAQELNAQSEDMKRSVAELMKLVGGQSETSTTGPAPHTARAKALQAAIPKAKRHLATNGNGHTHAATATAGNRQSEIPMVGDFKDF
ncbi:MAG: methyl-accepting chemotaxis protein [Verrucomicrobiae bacterium]|nr:methyl-accepting chemotaxis protein [Verrucomicrobiae bacterium]